MSHLYIGLCGLRFSFQIGYNQCILNIDLTHMKGIILNKRCRSPFALYFQNMSPAVVSLTFVSCTDDWSILHSFVSSTASMPVCLYLLRSILFQTWSKLLPWTSCCIFPFCQRLWQQTCPNPRTPRSQGIPYVVLRSKVRSNRDRHCKNWKDSISKNCEYEYTFHHDQQLPYSEKAQQKQKNPVLSISH